MGKVTREWSVEHQMGTEKLGEPYHTGDLPSGSK